MPSAQQWDAEWISYAYDPREDLGVFAFRRKVTLASVPEKLQVRVSADQRYKLYVNGEFVGFGPQRGDVQHWFYETYDLAPHLQTGENWITSIVWNFGRWSPMAQHSARTGFVLSGAIGSEKLSTPNGWEVLRLDGWSFDMMHAGVGQFYIDIGPGEIVEANARTVLLSGDAIGEPGKQHKWRKPHGVSQAEDRGSNGGGTPWMLVPRSLPPMRYDRRAEAPTFRRGFAGDSGDVGPKDGQPLWSKSENDLKTPIRLEPGKPILLDYGELLCAFPLLFVKCEGKAEVKLTYDEGLWRPEGGKGNRSDVKGKSSKGYQDVFRLDGYSWVFEPLWWRTYRYLRIESDAPVEILSIEAAETGYPLKEVSSFEADDPSVKPIWDVSVRTAERCAGESYFDCPYYEQLQYVGDTRIQALIGYYLGRDRALQRNAVETLGWSIMENGLTQSRYPSRQTQVIPPFSLWWVLMVWDQMLYDRDFQESRYRQAGAVVEAWNRLAADAGYWCFGDWVPTWGWGVPPGGKASLMHGLLAQWAAAAANIMAILATKDVSPHDLEEANRYRASMAESLRENIKRSGEGLLKDGEATSEHIEALWRCLQGHLDVPIDPWPTDALAKANAARCTYYFSYYKHLAMFGQPVGESRPEKPSNTGEPYPFDYLEEMQPWKEMLSNGLSTFAENPEPTRSDCHAWSAHPILGFFQIVAGVTSTAPGWKRARIMPHPGKLKRFDARIDHPDGELRVRWQDGKFDIDSPIPFEFRWMGRRENLKPGKHRL